MSTNAERATLIVLCNAVEGQDEDFMAWLRGDHASDMLAVPGVEGVTAYRATEPNGLGLTYTYVVRYEVKGPAAGVLEEIDRRISAGTMSLHPAFDASTRVRGTYVTFCETSAADLGSGP